MNTFEGCRNYRKAAAAGQDEKSSPPPHPTSRTVSQLIKSCWLPIILNRILTLLLGAQISINKRKKWGGEGSKYLHKNIHFLFQPPPPKKKKYIYIFIRVVFFLFCWPNKN